MCCGKQLTNQEKSCNGAVTQHRLAVTTTRETPRNIAQLDLSTLESSELSNESGKVSLAKAQDI
jgi:hypothetical protein